ncbi:MAG TPA: hypothetical protein VGS21_06640, partial [Acidimicrobiales bacterium]|nr:hypothetical protein [Acidimicrobiales bacterium]
TPLTNVPPPGQQCFGAPNFCVPYVPQITPVGNTVLTVTGVEPNGQLDLSVSTSAVTTLSVQLPGNSETCSDTPTNIVLSTVHPTSRPKGSPIKPLAPNPDLRGPQTQPLALNGPLGTASATVFSNNFSVAAFSASACPLLSTVFNAPLAGWNAKPSQDPATVNNNYQDKKVPPAIAGNPGWVQFSATTTVSSFGLLVGPPPGFSLTP